ncbi:DmsE family decaheme c-type cytochrome [Pseudothauera nasutitermitis]|uniref:DmsE family decaheme c-type cytochrome n=1 Tax=Pseudothauera nasutitermitis TaxID=2565930 RepID=A0A4V3WBK6_9RHOO|nr:DmsE family decaheme c-type cytochrome [Pseudothauera nasutitermitis]
MISSRTAYALALCVSAFFLSTAYAAEKGDDDLILRGDAQCTSCHDDADDSKPTMLELRPSVLAIGKTRHGVTADGRTPTCTDCHGESESHLNHKGSGKPPKPDLWFGKNTDTPALLRNESCLSCHQGGKHINWQSSVHANSDVACTSCHKVHTDHDKVRDKKAQTEVCFACHKEQRVQVNRPSHHPVLEGKVACTSCHDVHNDNPKTLIKSSTNDTCYSCHMEKRGPFVHSHQPVTEDCAICHNPHGTTSPNLLKSRPPFLCQSCHDGLSHHGAAASLPQGPGSGQFQTVGRACLNCHTNIHGSNSTQNSADGTAGGYVQSQSLRR